MIERPGGYRLTRQIVRHPRHSTSDKSSPDGYGKFRQVLERNTRHGSRQYTALVIMFEEMELVYIFFALTAESYQVLHRE